MNWNYFGKFPFRRENASCNRFINNLVKDDAIIGAASLISLDEILSRPVALEVDILVKIFNTASPLVGLRSKVACAHLIYSSNDFEVLGNFAVNFVPTLAKSSFKRLAIT